ncbi:MAG: dihydrofolate reductase [Hyphomicrobiales bacterium]|nr:dihydrofolate reductase [Hyphomicrobiales bacterium]
MTSNTSPIVIEGHAIVSADGMIASADGSMPQALRNDADWRIFQAALDRATLVVLGRLGHLRHPNPGRRRLVFTRGVEGLQPDASDPLATYCNPGNAAPSVLFDQLGISGGLIAVTGGTGVFDYFLPHYDRFALAEVHEFTLLGGTPCFAGGHPRTMLAASGLRPTGFEMIDEGVSLTQWQRER